MVVLPWSTWAMIAMFRRAVVTRLSTPWWQSGLKAVTVCKLRKGAGWSWSQVAYGLACRQGRQAPARGKLSFLGIAVEEPGGVEVAGAGGIDQVSDPNGLDLKIG